MNRNRRPISETVQAKARCACLSPELAPYVVFRTFQILAKP
jgi:hypothetical protein